MSATCDNCGKSKDQVPKDHGVWWTLTNYYKIWGYFCSDCYELVSHDGSGNPKHRNEWSAIAVIQQLKRSK